MFSIPTYKSQFIHRSLWVHFRELNGLFSIFHKQVMFESIQIGDFSKIYTKCHQLCPCPWHGGWKKWSFRSLSTQTFIWLNEAGLGVETLASLSVQAPDRQLCWLHKQQRLFRFKIINPPACNSSTNKAYTQCSTGKLQSMTVNVLL